MQLFDRDEPAREKIAYVTVKATDRGTPPLEAICTFNVTIGDINDNAPMVCSAKITNNVSNVLMKTLFPCSLTNPHTMRRSRLIWKSTNLSCVSPPLTLTLVKTPTFPTNGIPDQGKKILNTLTWTTRLVSSALKSRLRYFILIKSCIFC